MTAAALPYPRSQALASFTIHALASAVTEIDKALPFSPSVRFSGPLAPGKPNVSEKPKQTQRTRLDSTHIVGDGKVCLKLDVSLARRTRVTRLGIETCRP